MRTLNRATLTMILLLAANHVAAQQPPRPTESARSVTLSLAEYNRLMDLGNRPPQGPLPAPVAAVLAAADLRIRVERGFVRGVFNLTGDVLRTGVNRVQPAFRRNADRRRDRGPTAPADRRKATITRPCCLDRVHSLSRSNGAER